MSDSLLAASSIPAPDDIGTEAGNRRNLTRLRIIKAAASVFAERGCEAATVAEILEAAGVSRRTFYQFFSDKTDALLAIYLRSTAHLMEVRREAMEAPGSGLEKLRRGQQVYLDFVASSGPIIRVMAAEAMRPGGPLMARRLWLHQAVEELYRQTYRASEGAELDPLAVRGLILYTESLTLHVLLQLGGDPATLNQARALLADQLDLLVAGARPLSANPA